MNNLYSKLFTFLGLLWLASPVFASEVSGASLGLLWTVPFVGVLLSIALCPIWIPSFWHHHFGKIIAGWTGLFLIPYACAFGVKITSGLIIHALLTEYLPFIVLLFTLYTLSGGILVWGRLNGTPKVNMSLLALGTLLASVMGTTGAAMLLIRPLLKANQDRKHNVHVVIFFIFLVANIGGGLTPLGDPPLFIGFLKGIDFFWPLQHMLLPVVFASSVLLTLFYFFDCYLYKKEGGLSAKPHHPSRIQLFGTFNFILIGGAIGAVAYSGIAQSGVHLRVAGVSIPLESVIRDGVLLLLALLSWRFTPNQVRAGNAFSWAPIIEVAKLFIGIFITITPVISILQANEQGALASVLRLVSTSQGEPIDSRYFWITGFLSAFLDNAPTYLIFFNLAHGDPIQMMGPLASTLLAISMGAVFMGALTYIGNAPNFMVKAIAEQYKVKMPGFFGYMLWSASLLLPLFWLISLILF